MASLGDQAVLQAIFNPNTPFGDVLGLDPEVELTDDDSRFDPVLVDQAKDLELQGISLAESGNVDAALETFSQAIRIVPERASGYNNRAQALRLKGDTTEALNDLNKAVELSGGQGRTASQALVQRGLIYRLNQQDQEALQDFRQAAGLGNRFARSQTTLMNPYAALCNRMLTKMMADLRNPKPPPSPSV
ncbi:tetratricopeptide repeat protein 36 [Heptranchias perlo]|uniref:tetratricopeptide repeat protein 36 n=1 Tax=Heptranchias perlo TaxID=212740 RepID=UPI003559DD99